MSRMLQNRIKRSIFHLVKVVEASTAHMVEHGLLAQGVLTPLLATIRSRTASCMTALPLPTDFGFAEDTRAIHCSCVLMLHFAPVVAMAQRTNGPLC